MVRDKIPRTRREAFGDNDALYIEGERPHGVHLLLLIGALLVGALYFFAG